MGILCDSLQKDAASMTSDPARLPSAHHVVVLTVFLMNRTEPSANNTFTPPGCRLVVVAAPPPVLVP
jgi:hypothetical protein